MLTCSQVFDFIGEEEQFVPPAGVDRVYVTARGGAGGTSSAPVDVPAASAALVSGTLTVASGVPLYVEVGGRGRPGRAASASAGGAGGAGGANGGGPGGDGGFNAEVGYGGPGGGGGGGASDVRTVAAGRPGSLNSRLLVAAGGGGSSGGGDFSSGNATAGGAAGQPGSALYDGAEGGQPGVGAIGGAGGLAGEGDGGYPGTLGTGGAGGSTPPNANPGGGGGGGAGWAGGGGGSVDAGGGGGSSMLPADGTLALADPRDLGQVTVSWTVPAVRLAVGPNATIVAGQSAAFTATAADTAGNPADVTSAATFTITPATGGGGSTVGAACTGASCTAATAGNYAVTAHYGSVTGSATLTVTPAPAPPARPTVTSATEGDGQITVVFTPGDPGYPAVVSYTATATPTTGSGRVAANTGAGSPITITGLTNGISYAVTVTATNAAGSAASAPFGPITVGVAPSVRGTPPAGKVGDAYSFAFTVTGTPAPTVTVSNGTLPAGLILSSAGVLSGTPTAPGQYPFTVTASNGVGATASVSVIVRIEYAFSGFTGPVDNPPMVNTVKAGSAVPVKFSLGGNYGLNIFTASAGGPTFTVGSCTGGTEDPVTVNTTPTSELSYDPASGQYTYVWKTTKGMANQCGTLNLNLNDGSTHTALFKLR